jgi:phage terminase Nu1 subunit (DNA packaging protein)
MGYTGKGKKVNRTDLADIMGCALNTIDAYIKAGMPVIARGSRGKEWVFNSADCINWKAEKSVADATNDAPANDEQLRSRALLANTLKVELELAKARELVAPLDQVERMVARAFAEVRAGMRNIPSRVVSLLIGETDERRFKKVLAEEIDQALEALANADLAGSDEGADEDNELDLTE